MFQSLSPIEPIDYLAIGHITQDITTTGITPGGTVSYAALTAKAFGLQTGLLTSFSENAVLPNMDGVQIINQPAEHSTVFENIYSPKGRQQVIHSRAELLHPGMLPESWFLAPIIHLAPVAQEVDTRFLRTFPNSFIGLTPQGYFREWDTNGNVHFSEWLEANHILGKVNAAVLSIEDVMENEELIADLVYAVRVLVVTEGSRGARVYWHGDVRKFRPPQVNEIDSTGAGDIFAAAFFIRLYQTRDPWESARFATLVASRSVTRPGLSGVPTELEIQDNLIEIINKP